MFYQLPCSTSRTESQIIHLDCKHKHIGIIIHRFNKLWLRKVMRRRYICTAASGHVRCPVKTVSSDWSIHMLFINIVVAETTCCQLPGDFGRRDTVPSHPCSLIRSPTEPKMHKKRYFVVTHIPKHYQCTSKLLEAQAEMCEMLRAPPFHRSN